MWGRFDVDLLDELASHLIGCPCVDSVGDRQGTPTCPSPWVYGGEGDLVWIGGLDSLLQDES